GHQRDLLGPESRGVKADRRRSRRHGEIGRESRACHSLLSGPKLNASPQADLRIFLKEALSRFAMVVSSILPHAHTRSSLPHLPRRGGAMILARRAGPRSRNPTI